MTPLRFRAWLPELKEMRFFPLLSLADIDSIMDYNAVVGEFTGRAKIMQSTGLKDKNGKGIFEGDIVRYLLPKEQQPDESMETHDFNVVEWDSENACYSDFLTSYGYDELEIIGNIYENPELFN